MLTYKEITSDYLSEIKEIYLDSNWQAYLKDDAKLKRAFDNSLFTLGAFKGDKPVGFIRCVGDAEHIVLVQDLIVLASFRRKGIGKYLFNACLEKYKDVRMFQVVTDIEDVPANSFYSSLQMKKLEQGNMVSYFR